MKARGTQTQGSTLQPKPAGSAPAAKPQAATQPPAPVNRGWAAKGSAPVNRAEAREGVGTPRPVGAVKPGVRSASFEAALDRDTHSRSVPGNKVSLLFDGVNSFPERNRMIDGAKETICFQSFIFNSDEAGWELANRLAAKAKEGVKVRVIYDAIGSNHADPKMFEMMKAAGVEVKAYGEKHQVWDLNDRWHEKHLIVDGRASVQGGMNVANEYALGGSGRLVFSRGKTSREAWRDVDVKLEGPAVADATRAFVRNWEELSGALGAADQAQLFPKLTEFSGGPAVRVVQSNPEVKGLVGTNEKLYLRAFEFAQKSITIENAYFLPSAELRNALIAAAKRGVDVRVMTNGRASTDVGFVADAARYFYDDLLKAGVKIFEKQGGTLHSKTATIDGEFSVVGSVNLNGRSKNQDSEVTLSFADEATARMLEQRFDEGLTRTVPVTLEALNRESFVTNLKQWALSTLAWTF